MDAAIISALSGLAGAAIGGATSVTASIFSERVKDQRAVSDRSWKRREALYTQFISTAAQHLADAVGHERDDPGAVVELYALVARIRLMSPQPVVAAAEAVTVVVQKTYEAPNRSLREINIFSASGDVDPLLAFSEACRADLAETRQSAMQ